MTPPASAFTPVTAPVAATGPTAVTARKEAPTMPTAIQPNAVHRDQRPAPAPTFIDADAVAERLGMARATLMRRRLELEERNGFPQPLGWSLRPMLWRADQVDYWLSQQGLPRHAEPVVDPALVRAGKVRLLAEARRA